MCMFWNDFKDSNYLKQMREELSSLLSFSLSYSFYCKARKELLFWVIVYLML
jgi:hypothetical protein